MAQTEVFRTAGLHWLDIINPNRAQLEELAKKYGLHSTSVEDCLEPEHLPKFEQTGAILFLILRAFDENCKTDADTVQNMTRKVALFIGPDFVITIHRQDQRFLAELRQRWKSPQISSAEVMGAFVADCLRSFIDTYEAPLEKIQLDIDALEKRILTRPEGRKGLTKGFYLKRRADLIERMLRRTADVVSHANIFGERLKPQFQDMKETIDRFSFMTDDFETSIPSLISTQLALESHRTNETMRSLTVISLFFLPLNFVAGIYGMNFEHMPELKWEYGYLFAIGLMIVVSLIIFAILYRKGWTK